MNLYKEVEVPADMDHLDDVMGIIQEIMSNVEVDEAERMKVELAVEEMYTNIASYAYSEGNGSASAKCKLTDHPGEIIICFTDTGKPYNPLDKPDPDINAGVEERGIGGLGIYMTKKMMDNVSYEYVDNRNVLTIRKNFD